MKVVNFLNLPMLPVGEFPKYVIKLLLKLSNYD